ncbi:MAG: Gfo/Idh/MocA family oxidoreductase [Chloroflexi bacterium]|nr:Gfo/Idh/MocA family oxidoreductase [Chloroflexota bacterium]
MANERVRLGVIGANPSYGWGMRAHLPGLIALPDVELTAVCTAHEDTAAAARERWGAQKAYSDYRSLIDDPDIDVVDVCVRVPLHYQMVKAALEAGKHVFCEWALGRTTAEAEELATLARRQGVRTMVGLQARGAPGFQYMRQLIREGYVGRVVSCTMTQNLPGTLRPRPSRSAWSADRAQGVGGLSIGTGHALDVFLWCVGDLAEASALVSTQITEWPLSDAPDPVRVTSADNVAITGRLVNGAVINAHIANVPWHGGAFRMEVYGTEGTLVATTDQMVQFVDVRLQGGRHDERALQDLQAPASTRIVPETVPAGVPFNVAQMIQRLAEAVRSGAAVEPDFDDAVRMHRVLDALQRSSDTRSWVSLVAPS